MAYKFFSIFYLTTFVCCGLGHRQSQYFTTRGKQLRLTEEQKLAVFWFSSFSDSLKIYSAINKSSIPFNWDGDSIFTTRIELEKKFKKTKQCPDLIDTVFNRHDSLKKCFKKSPQLTFEIIEIGYYPCNNLRSHSILIAVDRNKNQVIGFYGIGSIRNRP